MIRFYRSLYTIPGRGAFEATWWQAGSRIFRHREKAV